MMNYGYVRIARKENTGAKTNINGKTYIATSRKELDNGNKQLWRSIKTKRHKQAGINTA